MRERKKVGTGEQLKLIKKIIKKTQNIGDRELKKIKTGSNWTKSRHRNVFNIKEIRGREKTGKSKKITSLLI